MNTEVKESVPEVKESTPVKEVKPVLAHRVKGSVEAKEYMKSLRDKRKPKGV